MVLQPRLSKIISTFTPKKHPADSSSREDIILMEYKNLHPTYVEFRAATHKAIEALLKQHKYKYQIVSRTKTPESLEQKLTRKKEAGLPCTALSQIEDLVGIRIIFYTESDKENFIIKIQNEISDFIKIEERKKDNGYNATHIVMSFGPKRLELSEYKDFRGLKFEVQITSILYHAWAEIEHDLIYKDIHDLKHLNPDKFKMIQFKMHHLLKKYIKKASEEFEKVISQKSE